MTQMNLSAEQNQTHRQREQASGCYGGERAREESAGNLELADVN